MTEDRQIKLAASKTWYKSRLFWALCSCGMVALGGAGFWIWHIHKPTPEPVPSAIRRSVSFLIYYPDQAKLPVGYTFNVHSFSASAQAVVYTISYGQGQKLVFSLQAKPSDDALKAFYTSHLPLHSNVVTAIGTAAIGILNNQTFVSLPTNGNAWLLITAPLQINQTQLRQVVEAIKKPA